MTLDRYSAFTLQIHGVQQLFLHLSLDHRAGIFKQSIGQSCLAMIDVSDDAEVANAFDVSH